MGVAMGLVILIGTIGVFLGTRGAPVGSLRQPTAGWRELLATSSAAELLRRYGVK